MVTALVGILFPVLSFAQKLSNPAPGAGSDINDFIMLLLAIMQWVAAPVLVVSIIYAGFILVTAGGNEAEIAKGKTWITWTLVGALIVLGAKVIASAVIATADKF